MGLVASALHFYTDLTDISIEPTVATNVGKLFLNLVSLTRPDELRVSSTRAANFFQACDRRKIACLHIFHTLLLSLAALDRCSAFFASASLMDVASSSLSGCFQYHHANKKPKGHHAVPWQQL